MTYAAMFFVMGALLVSFGYGLVRRSFAKQGQQLGASVRVGQKSMLPGGPVAARKADAAAATAKIGARVVAAQQHLAASALHALLWQFVIAGAVVAVLAALAGWIMAGRLIRPLRRITAMTHAVAADTNLSQRIHLQGPDDELKELADTMDVMLERLDRAFDGQRRFVANASHELRTPLAASRTLLQVALGRPGISADLRKLAETLLDMNTEQQRISESLLMLARAGERLSGRQHVDLAQTAVQVAHAASAEARSGGVELSVTGAPAHTCGDPMLLEALVRNLISNGIRHNHPGGWVTAETGGDLRSVWLAVRNTGPELAASAIEEIFEPFRKLGSERVGRPGSGLGLSIVRSIVRAHDGEVTARPRSGGGLDVRVILRAEAPGGPSRGHAIGSGRSLTVMADPRTAPPPTASTAG